MNGTSPGRMRFLATAFSILVMFVSASVDAANPVRRTWTIEGVTREALVAVPSNATTVAAPVVFAFHHHGDSMYGASGLYHYHTSWPEAIVVYMQGLKTPGQFIDKNGNLSGWQRFKGDQGDRDLKLFDAVLASLGQDYKVDTLRTYSAGFSNGGNFTYLLWAERGDVFAAMAPCAGVANGFTQKLTPKPLLHIASTNDGIESYALQKATFDVVKSINQCSATGTTWENVGTLFPSVSNNPVITWVTNIGHAFPGQAPELIVKFFKTQSKPVAPVSGPVIWLTKNGSSTSRQPQITWKPVAGAVRYDLWVNDMTNYVGQIIRDQNITTTTYTPPSPLKMGTYHMWVRGVNAVGVPGLWSERLELKITLVPQLIEPLATTDGPRPVFRWNAVPGAMVYQIWISPGTINTIPFVRDDTLTTVAYTPTVNFPPGDYRWWIRARAIKNGFETIGPWTPAQTFSVNAAP